MEKQVMKKSLTPRSPNKDNALKISFEFLNEVELNTKNLSFDLKIWTEALIILALNIDKFDKVIQKTVAMNSQELAKECTETQTKLSKMKKVMETKQKALNKLQTDFEKKLVTPMEKGDFNALKIETLNEVKENIRKIQEGNATNHKALNIVIEKSIEYTRRLVVLEDSINKICLPDEMEKTAELNEKLVKRLMLLCEVTSKSQQTPENSTSTCEPNLEKSFLHLYTEHQKEKALLTLIQKNINVPDEKTALPKSSNSNGGHKK